MNYQRAERTPAEQAELDRNDRRQFWIIAVIFTIAITALTGLYVAMSSVTDPPSPGVGAAQQIDEPAMPIPDGGAKPADSGDRGGSTQLILMGGLFVALAGGTAWVVHSSRKARRRLANGEVPETDEVALSVSATSPTPR